MRMCVTEETRHDERSGFDDDDDNNNDNGTCLEADVICNVGG